MPKPILELTPKKKPILELKLKPQSNSNYGGDPRVLATAKNQAIKKALNKNGIQS